MLNIYLLNYNNYYNRIVKKYDTIEEYIPYVVGDIIENANFNPNDGVMAHHLIGNGSATWDIAPDYFIVTNLEGDIHSRWFVIESVRTRSGQFMLTLYRDLFADFYNKIIEAPAFIEKATLAPGDMFIFNDEAMTVNQIKSSEMQLKDYTGVPWIVGYFNRALPDSEVTISGTAASTNIEGSYDLELSDFLARYDLNTEYSLIGHSSNRLILKPVVNFGQGGIKELTIELDRGEAEINAVDKIAGASYHSEIRYYYSVETPLRNAFIVNSSNLINMITGNNYVPTITQYYINYFNNKIVYDEINDRRYKLVAELTYNAYTDFQLNINTSLRNSLDALFENVEFGDETIFSKTNYEGFIECSFGGPKCIFRLVDTDDKISYNTTFKKSNERQKVIDGAFDMFCIPAGALDLSITIGEETSNFTTYNIQEAINIAVDMTGNFAAGAIYDMQLLPYCPIRNILKREDNLFKVGTQASVGDVQLIKNENGEAKGVIFWCTNSQGTFNVDIEIPAKTNAVEIKVAAMCDMYRLVSPNYNGQFEFSAEKNGGVPYFNVDYAYKPYQPYIHINPSFGLLYGQDFNDARGLILGGDFSLAIYTDAFATYALNNKNYQEMFDRSIQNLEVKQEIERKRQIWDIVGGAIGGAAGGAAAGAKGGPAGAVAGGITGSVVSTIGGIVDLSYGEILRNEAYEYAMDNFGYQLGNIRALPDNLTKVTSLNPNNKLFPILEYYTCTDTEKQALRDKVKYNGMTVMRIGKIADFLWSERTYIKGKLIRLENIADDFHVTKAIASEFNKGVYI